MSLLSIRHYNDPVLRQKGAPVTAFTPALRQLSADMLETMRAASGIGLAAQQIGQAIQLCVVEIKKLPEEAQWLLDNRPLPLDLLMPLVLINPKVTILESDDYIVEEGCLSFPGIRGDVTRPDAIQVTYQDLDAQPHTLVCNELLARCIQHEVDHLNGTLFIDRMAKSTRRPLDPAIKSLAQKTKDTSST